MLSLQAIYLSRDGHEILSINNYINLISLRILQQLSKFVSHDLAQFLSLYISLLIIAFRILLVPGVLRSR